LPETREPGFGWLAVHFNNLSARARSPACSIRSETEILPLANGNISFMIFSVKTAFFDELYRASGPQVLARLETGFPAESFQSLAAMFAMPTKTLAFSLGLNERTLRNRTRNLTGDESERTFRAYRVFRRASEVLGNEEAAKVWMTTQQAALGERKPVELLVRDIGTDSVLNVLAAIDDGGYL
jgi:putative toxin-antitoxin system antitoxin component (TIGR02293 family)